MYIVRAEFDEFDIRDATKVEQYLNNQEQVGLEFVSMCGLLFVFRKIRLVDQVKRASPGLSPSPGAEPRSE